MICGNRSNSPYEAVSHDLDDEEIEFKRMIETQRDNNGYDLDEDDLEDLDDIRFDGRDLDRLKMLEAYRDNLVSGASKYDGKGEKNDSLEEGNQNNVYSGVDNVDDIESGHSSS